MEPVFFWRPHEVPHGHFSQWFEHTFAAPIPSFPSTSSDTATNEVEKKDFGTAEQYMMYSKAVLFEDMDMAEQILKTSDPAEQRRLGRLVSNFVEAKWAEERSGIVAEGNYWKYTSTADGDGRRIPTTAPSEDPKLGSLKASPRDRIWGIGYGEKKGLKDWKEGKREGWGSNLLGKALMVARERIRKEEEGERNS
ncbi:DUF1768-domain-containing protein [Atractiella rhizophila]|nr:DUF1768-domain-containing protein [Atractiella rhizophila]